MFGKSDLSTRQFIARCKNLHSSSFRANFPRHNLAGTPFYSSRTLDKGISFCGFTLLSLGKSRRLMEDRTRSDVSEPLPGWRCHSFLSNSGSSTLSCYDFLCRLASEGFVHKLWVWESGIKEKFSFSTAASLINAGWTEYSWKKNWSVMGGWVRDCRV